MTYSDSGLADDDVILGVIVDEDSMVTVNPVVQLDVMFCVESGVGELANTSGTNDDIILGVIVDEDRVVTVNPVVQLDELGLMLSHSEMLTL